MTVSLGGCGCSVCMSGEFKPCAKHHIYLRAFDVYEQATGWMPLDDWDAFERWIDEHGGYEAVTGEDDADAR